MPWQYSLYLRHWSRHPNLVNTWHQKYFIFVRMMANILRDKLISFGWLFAFSYTLFWIWSLQVVFEVSLLLQQQHCCTTLVFCHSYALNELSTLAAALACLHKAKLSKKSVSKTTHPRCGQITEKVSFNMASEASYLYQSSNSVTRQASFNQSKSGENKCDILINF